MAASFVFTVACGKDAAEPATSASPSAPANTAAPSAPADPLGKFDPPITLRAAFPANANAKYAPGENVDNNEWTQGYANRLGINLKFDFTAGGEQYTTKFNMAVASRDLPEVFVAWRTQYQQLVDSDMLEDLGPALEKYGTPELKDIINGNGGIDRKAASVNGKLYALFGSSDNELAASRIVFLRKDWLDNLGLKEPKTISDVLAIAEAFATKDPNKDGKQTEYGFAFDKTLGGNYGALMSAFGAYPKAWLKDSSGQLVAGEIQPQVKEGLGKLAELYKKGVIDKEFGAKDPTTAHNKDVAAGRNGLFFTNVLSASLTSGVTDALKNDPKAEWAWYHITQDNGELIKYPGGSVPGSLYVVKKGSKNGAEALVKMLNFSYITREGTPEDYKTYYDREIDDGKGGKQIIQAFFHGPFRVANPKSNLVASAAVRKALTSKDASVLTSEQKAYYDRIVAYESVKDPRKDSENWKYYGIFGPGGSLELHEKFFAGKNAVMTNQYYGPTTEAMGKFQPALYKLIEETFTRIIMGAAPLSEFDTFVANWKSQGGDQLTKEVNDWFKAQK